MACLFDEIRAWVREVDNLELLQTAMLLAQRRLSQTTQAD